MSQQLDTPTGIPAADPVLPDDDTVLEAASVSAISPTDPRSAERVSREAFARNDAAPEYRERVSDLYGRYHELNAKHFGGRLLVPHLGIDRTPPRRLSLCRPDTNYGGAIEIVLSERAAFGTDTRLVREPWPALGLRRFLHDLLLGEMVKQLVLEVHRTAEDGYGGYGPLYAAEATRINPTIGLQGEVIARRRGPRGRGEPVAASWPWAFRDEGYYLGHVRLGNLPGATPRVSVRPESVVPGLCGYLLHLAQTNQTARLTDVLGRQVDFELEARSPAVAAFERSPHDASGMQVPAPEIDPDWLRWNGGTVRLLADGILTRRHFGLMPVLADALEDAGCDSRVLLNHCRSWSDHTGRCWALAALLGPDA